jgi:hypothetical protein
MRSLIHLIYSSAASYEFLGEEPIKLHGHTMEASALRGCCSILRVASSKF